jgi:hypothetical protein
MAEEQGKPPRRRRSPSRRDAEAAKQPKNGYDDGDGHGYDDGDGHAEHADEAVGAHAAFVAAHFGGGAAATPELLDRAIDVWQRLPGAVVRGAPLIRPNRPDRPHQADQADQPDRPTTDSGDETR